MTGPARFAPILALSLVSGGIADVPAPNPKFDAISMIVDPVAEDEIFNEGTSSPVVSFSILEGGVSPGTVDGGGVVDAESGLADVFGADLAVGTQDDDLGPTQASAAVDAGSNALLPTDRFDLDGDGDTNEPLPFDRAGNPRAVNGGFGASTTDMGAYEFGAGSIAVERLPDNLELHLSTPYPNPVTTDLTVDFAAATSGAVRLTVYDVIGREVLVPFEDRVAGGREYRVTVSTVSLASGIYFIRLTKDQKEISRRFVLAR